MTAQQSGSVTWTAETLKSAQVVHTFPSASAAERQSCQASTSGRHSSLMQRREWCNTAQMLRNQEHALDSTLVLPMDSLRDGRQLQLEVNQQATDRRLMASALTARTVKIKELVEAVVAKLANPEPGSDFVRSIAEALDAGEMQMTELKAEQRQNYDDLARQEQHLSRELELMLERLESPAWHLAPNAGQTSAAPAAAVTRVPAAYQPKQGGGLLPEVEAFDDFHEEHGPTGGWHPDDHSEFERILKTCKGDYSHATLVCYDHMIGFKRADIIAHARWHAEHQELYIRKRIALAEWRSRKEAHKAALAVQASVEPASAHQAQQQRQQQQEQARLSREFKRQNLAEWKASKEVEEQHRAAQLAEKQDLQKQAEAAGLAERQTANKQKLEEYHRSKAQQDAAAAAAAAAEAEAAAEHSTASLDAGQQQRLKARTEELMQRRVEAASAKLREEQERVARLQAIREQVSAKVNVKVKKDPQRILKATAAVQQRVAAQQEDDRAAKTSGFIRNISSKAVPAWRQPLKGMQV